MLDFTKLQLHGFKSFVEPTTLLIEPGLTGIVGPNGCGKSNLIEALRCVMGENSARRMRAPDMDNVIFSGTATRPSRNLAEISLWLDNSGRTAPAEFNDQHELQVTRVIERGEGSLYHINGRPVRQRDVQMVFADQATGAQANNIVGQGQIDALIRAKPQDRRKILEEAAGITGLEARRHEAELKLKAAEQNLQRAEDVLKTYESQQRSLKSQLRAAQRYRELNDGIQAHDMLLLHVRQQLVTQQIAETNQQMAILEHEIESLTQQITLTETARIEKTNELPPMRQAEAAAAALLQRLTLELEKIQAEQARVTKEQLNLQQQMAAAHNDHTHADHQLDDALATLQKLYTEQSQRQQQLEALRSLLPARAHDHHLVAEQVHAAEQNLHTLLATIAETESQRTSYQNQLQRAQAQVHTMQQRQADLESTRAHWEQQKRELPDLTLAKSMVDACEADVQKKQEQLQAAEQAEHDADATAKEAQQKVDAAQHELTKLRAEETALRDLLESQRGLEQRVLDLLEGTGGFETALAVAFGEALTAALNDEAPSYWQQRTLAAPLPPLPVGAEPLSQLVQAPAELQSLLSMTGLVNSDDEGRALAAQLLPGQILVTRDGWAWRWDGYTITPKATTTYATQLRQRARLQELAQLTKQSAQLLQNLQTHETMAREKFLLTRQAATDMRTQLQLATRALADAHQLHARQTAQTSELSAKLQSVIDHLARTETDLAMQQHEQQQVAEQLQALPDTSAQQQQATQSKLDLVELRQKLAHAHQTWREAEREGEQINIRLTQIADEILGWAQRRDKAMLQMDVTGTRLMVLADEQQTLAQLPEKLAEVQQQTLLQRREAEEKRQHAADVLVAAENLAETLGQDLKKLEKTLATQREARVRLEGQQEMAAAEQADIVAACQQQFQVEPHALPQHMAADLLVEPLPDRASLQQKLQKMVGEREAMGPINLRAEIEMDELQEKLSKLETERDDLSSAIAKLRNGIAELNGEARTKLNAAFSAVNARFSTLFVRLFNGGRAHLELQNADDPLQAGLEIYAAPPGKKIQALSLLSGGERTLTALSLLFAVFQTNPSPICVLDEAEAALDESNVDRFCQLVRDIAEETGTRFLVITHQRLTMARVDRLYGVTMAEKGVSQLVSVDLRQAEQLRDAPHIVQAA